VVPIPRSCKTQRAELTLSQHTRTEWIRVFWMKGCARYEALPSPDAIVGDVRRVREQISASDFRDFRCTLPSGAQAIRRATRSTIPTSARLHLTSSKPARVVAGMSYWTTPTFSRNWTPSRHFKEVRAREPSRIRKPTFFAYKYLNALQGNGLATSDPQAMLSTRTATSRRDLGFRTARPEVSNRSFYTKCPSHPAAPCNAGSSPCSNTAYSLVFIARVHANDAIPHIWRWFSKELTADQIAH